jgi:exonuclease SbcC
MRLIDLHVRDILGLKSASLSFEPGAVAIVGPNGAGKSSILDALLLALFGESTPVRPVKHGELVRVGSSRGEVVCLFEAKGLCYRVRRAFGKERRQEAFLERQEGEEWLPIASTVREVNLQIAKALNPWDRTLSENDVKRLKEAFLSTAFIPQGLVTRLVDSTPTERWQVLSAVLGLEAEEALQEGAKELGRIASASEASIKGKIEALRHELEALPEEEKLLSRLLNLEKKIGERKERLQGLRVALEARRKLDDLVLRERSAQLSLKEAEMRQAKLQRRLRMAQASSALSQLREAASKFGSSKSELRCREIKLKEIESRLFRLEEQRDELRKAYTEAQAARKVVELLASRVDLAVEARRLLDRAKEMSARTAGLSQKIDGLICEREKAEVKLLSARRQELERTFNQILEEHRKYGRELAEAVSSVRCSLLAWLSFLAPDGVLYVEEIKKRLNVAELARTLEASGLQRALSKWASLKQRCYDSLFRGQRVRQELMSLPAPDSEEQVEEQAEVLEKRIGELRSIEQKMTGQLALCVEESDRIERNLKAFPEDLADEEKIDLIIEAARAREKLLVQIDEIRDRGERVNEGIRPLEREAERERLEISALKGRMAQELDDLRRSSSEWRKLQSLNKWTVEELRSAVVESFPPVEASEVLKVRAEYEGALRALEAAKEELKQFLSGLPSEPPSREVLEAAIADEDKAFESVVGQLSTERSALEHRRYLEKSLKAARDEHRALELPLRAATKLVKLTQGRGFIQYVSNRITAEILGWVNEQLSDKPWRLFSRDGVIGVIQGGEERPASGLSGGERSLVALLMLRCLAMRLGFQGVLFIDEGLAMLDDAHLEQMVDVLNAMGQRAFVGVITHEPDVAAAFPRRWEVDDGRVLVR